MSTQSEHSTVMEAMPHAEHRWLGRLVGSWTVEGEMSMSPGEQPAHFKGGVCVRPIGDLWVVIQTTGDMPGMGESTIEITLGYDPEKQRVVGTVIGSMMTSLWLYNGTLDEAEGILTLDTEGPSMAEEGKMSNYRDTIQILNDDQWTMMSHAQSKAGEWQQFMKSTYTRCRDSRGSEWASGGDSDDSPLQEDT